MEKFCLSSFELFRGNWSVVSRVLLSFTKVSLFCSFALYLVENTQECIVNCEALNDKV